MPAVAQAGRLSGAVFLPGILLLSLAAPIPRHAFAMADAGSSRRESLPSRAASFRGSWVCPVSTHPGTVRPAAGQAGGGTERMPGVTP